MNTHDSGNIGEIKVMLEAARRGYIVSVPHGHNSRYDLIIDRRNVLLRVQVKTVQSDGLVVKMLGRSVGKLDGNLITKTYTADEIDAIAVYDITTDMLAFVPIMLMTSLHEFTLRIAPTANNQKAGINWFSDYINW